LEEKDFRFRRHVRFFFYSVVTAVLFVLALLLFKLLFPFALAWLLALLLQPAIGKLSLRTGLSHKTSAILILLITLLAGGALVGWLCSRLITELPELADSAVQAAETISEKVQEITAHLHQKIPFLRSISEKDRSELLGKLLREGIVALSQAIPAFAGSFLISLPGALFVSVIFLMAAFYLTTDFEGVSRYLSSLLPRKAVQKIGGLRQRLFSTTLSYLRAYWILQTITFAELLLTFLFLRVRYAITLALILALLDALPAIGTGVVLLPWGLIAFFTGDWKRGLFLCAVWLIVTLIRQFLEPRIIGAQLGLHPLAALAAVWAGFRLLGFWGLLLAPVGAILLRGVLDSRRAWVAEHDR
jgi:sporulation integral membrane protein YtvI